MSYDFRPDVRKSCLTSDIPPVSGSATRFFRNALRRSSFAWIVSASACFAATTAPMYFTKLIPHLSHFTPVRCLLPHEGHSKRMVMWQRWQKRAISRTTAPHLGQGIVACGIGAVVGSHASTRLGMRACVLDPRVASDSGLPTLPLTGPEGESLGILNLIQDAGWIRVLCWLVRLRGYPVRPDRCVKRAQVRDAHPPTL